MRFSYYSTLVLGLWLTGQCWVSGEGSYSYPKPSISVDPSETVALGGNVKIRCKSDGYTGMEFYLQRQLSSDFEIVRSERADHDAVVFPIVNATQSDVGIYRCIYCYKIYNCQRWSDYSDSVNISIKVIQPVGTYVRLGAASLVLLALVLIVAEAVYSWRKEHL